MWWKQPSDMLLVHSEGHLRESGGKAGFLTMGERTWLIYVNILVFYGNRIERQQIRVLAKGVSKCTGYHNAPLLKGEEREEN